eukprot:Skav213188  [mRNA]  locus=scaffold2826:52602:53174:+ [translate_table: standard]
MRDVPQRTGQKVISRCAAVILAGAKCLRKESALLRFRAGRRTVSRDQSIALVEKDGQQLVISSVHLHPPGMISGGTYMEYLEPVRQAVESLAGLSPDGVLQTPCLLLGDYNVAPEQFQQMTSTMEFWKQLLTCSNFLVCCW